jgi:ankyrin repeat protein
VNLVDRLGKTALIYACTSVGYRKIDGFRTLIDANADVNVADGSGKTALMFAVDHNFQDVVELLVLSRADASRLLKNELVLTAIVRALVLAIENSHYDLIDFFINSGADLSRLSENITVSQYLQGIVSLRNMYKSACFDFSGFAKALPDNNGSVVEVVEETINSEI